MKRNLIIFSATALMLSGSTSLVSLNSNLENALGQDTESKKNAELPKVLAKPKTIENSSAKTKSIPTKRNVKTQESKTLNVKPLSLKKDSENQKNAEVSKVLTKPKTIENNWTKIKPIRSKRNTKIQELKPLDVKPVSNTQLEYMDMEFIIDNSFKQSSWDGFMSTKLQSFATTIDFSDLKDFVYNSNDFIFKNFEIKGNDLYIITKKDIYKIDLITQKKTRLIHFNYKDSIENWMFKNNDLYVTTLLNKVYEINLNTKEKIEIASLENNIVKWVFNNDKLYAIQYYGKVYEINLRTGSIKWIFDSNSRLRIDDLVFVNDKIYAAIEGEIFELDFASKEIIKLTVYFGITDLLVINNDLYAKSWNSIYKLDLINRTQSLVYNFDSKISNWLFKDDQLYVVTVKNEVYQINLTNETISKNISFDQWIIGLAINDGNVYLATKDGLIHQLDNLVMHPELM